MIIAYCIDYCLHRVLNCLARQRRQRPGRVRRVGAVGHDRHESRTPLDGPAGRGFDAPAGGAWHVTTGRSRESGPGDPGSEAACRPWAHTGSPVPPGAWCGRLGAEQPASQLEKREMGESAQLPVAAQMAAARPGAHLEPAECRGLGQSGPMAISPLAVAMSAAASVHRARKRSKTAWDYKRRSASDCMAPSSAFTTSAPSLWYFARYLPLLHP